MVNVVWTPIERSIGRGVEVHGIAPESPLAKTIIQEGDALIKANGKKIKTPEDLITQNRTKRNDKDRILSSRLLHHRRSQKSGFVERRERARTARYRELEKKS